MTEKEFVDPEVNNETDIDVDPEVNSDSSDVDPDGSAAEPVGDGIMVKLKTKIATTYAKLKADPTVDMSVLICALTHPVFALLLLRACFSETSFANVFGCIFLGLLTGSFFAATLVRAGFKLRGKMAAAFSALPALMYALLIVGALPEAKTNYLFLVLGTVYIALGGILYAHGNREKTTVSYGEAVGTAAVLAFAAFVLLVGFIAGGVRYSPDSMGYYDMSRQIFTDFGKVSTVRQYTVFTEYGISFPYLFPMLIAIVNFFTGLGIYSGNVINCAAALVTLLFAAKTTRNLCGSAIPGGIAMLLVFTHSHYMGEFSAARAVPLSLMCAVLVLWAVSRTSKLTPRDLLLAGIFAGAGMVIRLDFLALAGLTGIIASVAFLRRKLPFKAVVAYAAGILVFAAPWIIYSISHFGTLWVSDNSGTIFRVQGYSSPQIVFLPEEEVQTLFTHPDRWLEVTRGRIRAISSGIHLFYTTAISLTAVIAALAFIAAARMKNKSSAKLIG